MKDDEMYEAGMAVRRKILGDAHVDRAVAKTSPLTREFQDLIVRYGWGAIWTRPGLGHRERRLLVIGTMMAIGRWEEFEMHVRAALESGFPLAEVFDVSRRL
jgi:alkylhydroperoxidase/carboxymuconolactone decarboxylase family protein YurZ